MHRKHVDVISIRLYHSIQEPVLDSKDDGELRPAVQFRVAYFRIVDLFEGTEMDY